MVPELHRGAELAHREYRDCGSVAWQVWEVIPPSVNRRRLGERRIAPRDATDGRQRHEARLRLSDDDTQLESRCARAERASRPVRRLIE